jgi:hypothetical protein
MDKKITIVEKVSIKEIPKRFGNTKKCLTILNFVDFVIASAVDDLPPFAELYDKPTVRLYEKDGDNFVKNMASIVITIKYEDNCFAFINCRCVLHDK